MKRKMVIQLYLLTALFVIERFVPVSNYVLPKENYFMLSSITKADKIGWRYEMREDGKLYKRLYNYTTDSWIGDWIPVG